MVYTRAGGIVSCITLSVVLLLFATAPQTESPDKPYNFLREFDLPLTTNAALMLALTVFQGCPLFERPCNVNNLP